MNTPTSLYIYIPTDIHIHTRFIVHLFIVCSYDMCIHVYKHTCMHTHNKKSIMHTYICKYVDTHTHTQVLGRDPSTLKEGPNSSVGGLLQGAGTTRQESMGPVG